MSSLDVVSKKDIYDNKKYGIAINNKRVVLGEKKYAMNTITSAKQYDGKVAMLQWSAIGGSGFCIVVCAYFAFTGNWNIWSWVASVVALLMGYAIKLNIQDSRTPMHTIKIESAGEEIDALKIQGEDGRIIVAEVVKVINQVISERE